MAMFFFKKKKPMYPSNIFTLLIFMLVYFGFIKLYKKGWKAKRAPGWW